MIILAIDTSSAVGRVSVARAGAVTASGRFGERESHMREIGAAVDGVLSRSGLALADVDRIALVSGPGSFTGLRIGMAFVKGLHAATDIPVVTMHSLELLALPLVEDYSLVLSMIDARKDQVYAALYRHARADGDGLALATVLEPTVAAPRAVLSDVARLHESAGGGKTLICAGSGTARYAPMIAGLLGERALLAAEEMNVPSADVLALRAPALEPVPDETLLVLEPYYIRSSDAELKRLKEITKDG